MTRPKKSGSVQSFFPDSSSYAAPATTNSGSKCSSPPGGWHALAHGARSQSTSSFLRSAAGAAQAAVSANEAATDTAVEEAAKGIPAAGDTPRPLEDVEAHRSGDSEAAVASWRATGVGSSHRSGSEQC